MLQYFSRRGHIVLSVSRSRQREGGEKEKYEGNFGKTFARLIIRRLITRLVAAVCLLRPRRWKAFVASGSRPRTAAVEEGTIAGTTSRSPENVLPRSFREMKNHPVRFFGFRGRGRIFPLRGWGRINLRWKSRGQRGIGAVTRIFLLGRDDETSFASGENVVREGREGCCNLTFC